MELVEDDQIWKVEDVFVCSTVQLLYISRPISLLVSLRKPQVNKSTPVIDGRTAQSPPHRPRPKKPFKPWQE
jgi:hypothetical protein